MVVYVAIPIPSGEGQNHPVPDVRAWKPHTMWSQYLYLLVKVRTSGVVLLGNIEVQGESQYLYLLVKVRTINLPAKSKKPINGCRNTYTFW